MRERDVEGAFIKFWKSGGRWMGLALALGLLIYGFLSFSESRNRDVEQKAFDELYSIEKTYIERRTSFEQSEILEMQGSMNLNLPSDALDKAKKPTGDMGEDYGDILSELKGYIESHKGTQASAYAGILLANIYAKYDQWNESAPLLQQLAQEIKDPSLFSGLLKMSTATALAESDKCSEALQEWEQILQRSELAFLHGEAALRSGLCLETIGQPEGAMEKYRLASEKAPAGSSVASSASQFLRALEILPRTNPNEGSAETGSL